MMDFILLDDGIETNTGSSKLKAYTKDSNFSLLDALIREATQNSIDAYDKEKNKGCINIDVTYSNFDSNELANQFPDIKDRLLELYGENDNRFLCLSDTNTVGLNGSTSTAPKEDEDKGNFNRLVFHTGRNEKSDDAGGAWGYGKAVYYKTGNGVVIFYSRVRIAEGNYENRLIVSITENEDSKNQKRLLTQENNVGIAWYGVYENKENKIFKALTDDDEIAYILNIFNIKPYENDETGTKIIIPYVDNKKLFSNFIKDDEEIKYDFEYCCDLINVCYQRWFCTRIDNPKFKNSLNVRINGKRIAYDENSLFEDTYSFFPIFKIYHELYSYTRSPEEYDGDLKRYIKHFVPISKQYVNGEDLGVFAYLQIQGNEANELLKLADYFNPYYYCGLKYDEYKFKQDKQKPLIAFQRNLGMVTDYVDSRNSGPWLKQGCESLRKDEFIIGLFVLSDNNLVDKYRMNDDRERTKPVSLNHYIRHGEKSSHSAWFDSELYNIDTKKSENSRIFSNLIQGKIARKIEEILHGTKKTSNDGYTIKSLAMILSRALLPDTVQKPKNSNKKASHSNSGTGQKKTHIVLANPPTIKPQNLNIHINFDDIHLKQGFSGLTFKFGLLSKNNSNKDDITCFDNKELSLMKCPVKITNVLAFNKNTEKELTVKMVKNNEENNDNTYNIGFYLEKPFDEEMHIRIDVEYKVLNNKYAIGYDIKEIE